MTTMLRRLVVAFAVVMAGPAALAADAGPNARAPEGLARLAFLIGEWDLHARFGPAADAQTVTAKMTARWAMGGHALEMLVEYPPLQEGRPVYYATSLFTGIPGSDRLEMVSTNSLANRKQGDEVDHDGGFGAGSISFIQSGELFNDRQGVNRLNFHTIGEGEFHFQQDASLDGETWHVNQFSYRAERR